jgi:quinol monooxygenase YgiN
MRLFLKTTFSTMLCIVSMFVLTTNAFAASDSGMIVRISEIEIEPDYLQDYNQILQEEAEASVRLEPGVLAIFPMFQKEQPNQIMVLEIYASRQAYELHLKTPHFIKYKTTTLKMVKSLKLIDMQTIDPASMATIFGKMSTKL